MFGMHRIAKHRWVLHVSFENFQEAIEFVWNSLTCEIFYLGYEAHERLRFPPKSQLQSSVNAYLSAFSALEKSVEQNRLRQRTVPDADGFITVTRGGRAGPARLEEAQAAKEKLEERDKKRVGEDFYRFQLREKRKDGERELKRKFEEDKKRLEKMRAKRGKIRPE